MFGIFIGCLNMIPYMQILSIPIALLLGIVYSLDAGIPFWEVALMVTGIYVGIQLLQDLVLVPNIVGKSMNLPPIGILLSLSIWGKLLGFLGLIVAIPFTCLCLIYLQKISNKIEDHSNEELALEGSSLPINSEKSEKEV
jgi:predicted PurR-regulated permease PerM